MATSITISDLPSRSGLDHKAMLAITGAGGAPWVFGAFRPFVPESSRVLPIVNFFQTNNFFSAEQMNIQLQNIEVVNSAANALINVAANQGALNFSIG